MQILVATLRGAVHQQQRAAAYAALLPSLVELAWSRSRVGAGFCIFQPEPERSRSAKFKKKLEAGVEPKSDFKVVFEVVMIVSGRMSHYFCSLEMEYQNV